MPSRKTATPKLLAGGNPQIAKADGDAPVQAYIAAMPGWKREIGRRLDALITRTVTGVKKAVKWNSPFYGVEGKGWCLSVDPAGGVAARMDDLSSNDGGSEAPRAHEGPSSRARRRLARSWHPQPPRDDSGSVVGTAPEN